jgi:hypothetical protein
MTTALILNVALATVVSAAVVGLIAWSIVTQRRDAVSAVARTARRPLMAREARKFRGVPVRLDA